MAEYLSLFVFVLHYYHSHGLNWVSGVSPVSWFWSMVHGHPSQEGTHSELVPQATDKVKVFILKPEEVGGIW